LFLVRVFHLVVGGFAVVRTIQVTDNPVHVRHLTLNKQVQDYITTDTYMQLLVLRPSFLMSLLHWHPITFHCPLTHRKKKLPRGLRGLTSSGTWCCIAGYFVSSVFETAMWSHFLGCCNCWRQSLLPWNL